MITTDLNPATLWQALRAIPDPEFGVSIVDLGLIYSVECTPDLVQVVMTLTTSSCPSGGWIHEGVRAAVEQFAGSREVQVDLVFEPAWTTDRLSAEARRVLGGDETQ
ncbi:MAG: metal-sulfur cluster assembly factor [Opitutaceae bacterium]|nr:metal-sulfur cluster assembly factor [Opitutaceae bacterium]